VLDVMSVLDALGVAECDIVAEQWGAMIAVAVAGTHPERVRKMVLWNGLKASSDYVTAAELAPALELSLQRPDLYIELVVPRLAKMGMTAEGAQTCAILLRASVPLERWNEHVRPTMQWDAESHLGRVAADVLVVHRRDCAHVPSSAGAKLAAALPNASLRMLPGSLMYIWDGDREETLKLIDHFLVMPLEEVTAWSMRGGNAPFAGSTFRTILFTDVVASTPLLAQLKDAKMREVMREHDEVLEAAVTGNGGRVIKTMGDAFMAEFAVPSNAVEAAIAAQRNLRERFASSDVPIRIRIGINAGEPVEEDGDLHGASVVIAKRLESAADVNGILVSDVVKQMMTGKDFEFEDRGLVELKGFEEPVRAWAVRWE
jgi:class 3 adenylate cyclase